MTPAWLSVLPCEAGKVRTTVLQGLANKPRIDPSADHTQLGRLELERSVNKIDRFPRDRCCRDCVKSGGVGTAQRRDGYLGGSLWPLLLTTSLLARAVRVCRFPGTLCGCMRRRSGCRPTRWCLISRMRSPRPRSRRLGRRSRRRSRGPSGRSESWRCGSTRQASSELGADLELVGALGAEQADGGGSEGGGARAIAGDRGSARRSDRIAGADRDAGWDRGGRGDRRLDPAAVRVDPWLCGPGGGARASWSGTARRAVALSPGGGARGRPGRGRPGDRRAVLGAGRAARARPRRACGSRARL